MSRRSLVSQLIWLLTAAMTGLWLLGSVTTGMLTVFEINERLDNAIEEVAQRLLPATFDAVQEPQAMQQLARQLVATLDPRALAYQIVNPAGAIAMRSQNAPAQPFPVPRQPGFHNIRHYRVYTQPAGIKGYVIEVAEPMMHRREALRRAVGLSVGPLLFLVPLSWFLIRWVVYRSAQSLTYLREQIGPTRRVQPVEHPGSRDAGRTGTDPDCSEPTAGAVGARAGRRTPLRREQCA